MNLNFVSVDNSELQRREGRQKKNPNPFLNFSGFIFFLDISLNWFHFGFAKVLASNMYNS